MADTIGTLLWRKAFVDALRMLLRQKRFRDLFKVATTTGRLQQCSRWMPRSRQSEADGIERLFHRAVIVVTVGKQAVVWQQRSSDCSNDQDFFLASISMIKSTSSPIAPR